MKCEDLIVKVLGKNILEKGYCFNTKTMNDEKYYNALATIRSCIPKQTLLALPLTDTQTLTNCGYEIPPQIIKYSEDYTIILDPNVIWYYCKNGINHLRPSADFLIFNEDDDIAILAYSKGAPVLVFEDDYGNIAVGILFRQQLIKHGEYIFHTILGQMKGKVKLSVPICTHHYYEDWGTVPDYIKKLCHSYPNITEVCIGVDTEADENLFNHSDSYNNAVIVYFNK